MNRRGWLLELPTLARPVGRMLTRGATSTPTVPAKNPDEVTGLTFWVRSTDLIWNDPGVAPPVAGARVLRWDSKATGGYQFATTTGNEPVYRIGSINSLPSVEFNDGTTSGSHMMQSGAISTFLTATAYCVFCVFKIRTVATNAAATYSNDAVYADAGGYWGHYLKSDNTLHAFHWDGSDIHTAVAITSGTWYASEQRVGGGVLSVVRNGPPPVETSVSSGAIQAISNILQLGRGSAPNFFKGEVAEFFVYNTLPVDNDRLALREYLRNRYSVAPP